MMTPARVWLRFSWDTLVPVRALVTRPAPAGFPYPGKEGSRRSGRGGEGGGGRRRVRGLALGVPGVLAATVCLGAVSSLTAPARAQMPVIDTTAIGRMVQQLAQAQQRYQELVSQYQQMRETYGALAQDVNPNQWARQLEQPLLQDPLPDTTMLPGVLAGISPPAQLGGNLGLLAQSYLGQNQVYLPQGQDFQSTQLRNSANATAEIEAVATQNMQSLQAREADLPQIQDQLNNASTIQQVASIQARLSAEQSYVQAQTAQAANLQVLVREQQQARHTAQTEIYRQGLDQGIAAECANLARLGAAADGCSP